MNLLFTKNIPITMNKLELLKTFVRVTETGSFTQTADSLGLQKASVSEHIRVLENLVGARLFHRTTRRVQITHDGLALLERAKDLLSDMEDLEDMFACEGSSLEGRLRADMSTGVARLIVLPRLSDFLQRHPKLQVEISSTDRRVDLVREGFDCVLRVGTVAEPSLIVRPLGASRMVNVASPAYLRQFGMPRSLGDLSRHRLIFYSTVLGAKPAGFEYVADDENRMLPMAGSVTVNNADAYEAACLGGLGIAQMPLHGALHHLRDGTLQEVLPEFIAEPMPVSLLYAHRRHLPQRVRVFMDWLAALMEDALRTEQLRVT